MEQKIKADLKKAQLSRDALAVSTLRLVISELTNARIQKGHDLDDDEVAVVLKREAKKRVEAAESFTNGGRLGSAQKEQEELKVIENYLPAQMSDEELTKIVESHINKVGANSMQELGRVIGLVMAEVGSKADGGRVSAIVKEKLQG